MRKPEVPEVPEVEGVDLDFTPPGYFTARDLHLQLPSDIKGQARREIARSLAEDGRSLPPELAAPELTEEDRRAWGRIHPALMGGEYLPSLEADEVEIARISLASVTGDQISVRARRLHDGIEYSIVDEYGSDEYAIRPATSRSPLSMRELVRLLDGACVRGGAVMSVVVWNLEDRVSSVDEMRGFVRVESDFYPCLGAYYGARLDRYLDERAMEEGTDP